MTCLVNWISRNGIAMAMNELLDAEYFLVICDQSVDSCKSAPSDASKVIVHRLQNVPTSLVILAFAVVFLVEFPVDFLREAQLYGPFESKVQARSCC
jgi:hypothetical protein